MTLKKNSLSYRRKVMDLFHQHSITSALLILKQAKMFHFAREQNKLDINRTLISEPLSSMLEVKHTKVCE
jgi:hypothetical protein